MTPCSEAERPSEEGFTLVEMLVVIAILALTAAAVIPSLRSPDTLIAEKIARDMSGAIQATRAAAIIRRTEMVFVVDIDQRTYESAAIPKRTFPNGIFARLVVAEQERLSASRAGFRFFPDGSSTGGDLALTSHNREIRICVNWLTGQPLLKDKC